MYTILQGFAAAAAIKGLSDRPLETFGASVPYKLEAKPSTEISFLFRGLFSIDRAGCFIILLYQCISLTAGF